MSKDGQERAKEQAKAQIEGICEMMTALEIARKDDEVEYEGDWRNEEAMRVFINEDALAVEVRSDWHNPNDSGETDEFLILLCTGGPAVRIIGGLDRGSPMSATVQYQDWFTLWTDYTDISEEQKRAILAYCRHYWFGD